MPVRKVPPGDSYQIGSESFNRFVDAASFVETAKRAGSSGSLGFAPQTSIVLLKNVTGSTVNRWGILQPTTPLILPATSEEGFLSGVAMSGSAPAKNKPAFIALEPVANNEIGRFMAPGVVVPVKIEKEENITYKIARASTSMAKLDAIEEADVESDDRTVQIIWHESGTGEKWALVLMPGRQSPSLTVLGPCATYTPAAELADTDFDVVFPGGCVGPSRYGLNYRNLITNTATFIPLELEDPEAEVLVFSSDVFSHSCGVGSMDVYAKLTVTSLDREGVLLEVLKESDDSQQSNFENTIFSWQAMQAGYLQFGPGPGTCSCPTFPYEICLSTPTR